MKARLNLPGTSHVGTAPPGCPVEQGSTAFSYRGMKAGATSRLRALKAIDCFAWRFKYFLSIFGAALGEIFDESAYARFLSQRKLVSSRAAYAAFRGEHEDAKARRPKCC